MRMAVLALLGFTGCLYIEEINHAPQARIDPIAISPIFKGVSIPLSGTLFDAEDGTRNLKGHWTAEYVNGGSPTSCESDIGDDASPPGRALGHATFFRAGTWRLSLETHDSLGATTIATADVEVSNAAPAFSVMADQLFTTSAKSPLCQSYVAGQPMAITLEGIVTDADAMPAGLRPGCEMYRETLSYTWKIVSLPSSSAAVIGPKPSQSSQTPSGDAPCPPTPPPGLGTEWHPGPGDVPRAICFYPDVGGGTAAVSYQLMLAVSDGTTEIRSSVLDLPMLADQPSCVTGSEPAAGSYIVDRNQVQSFQVTGVTDDLDSFPSPNLSYVWSLWRQADPVWRQIPSYNQPSYSLDASSFGVGEKVRVRVEPLDRRRVRATCDPDADSCAHDSCLILGSQCQAWITWDLELR
jgi:hypothetical protein